MSGGWHSLRISRIAEEPDRHAILGNTDKGNQKGMQRQRAVGIPFWSFLEPGEA